MDQRKWYRGELPVVACLCPTYNRRKLLENSIAQFHLQTYPVCYRHLFVLDDLGDVEGINQEAGRKNVHLQSQVERCNSLGMKYNALAEWAKATVSPDVIVVWEDDDIYFPEHIDAAVFALRFDEAVATKPKCVLFSDENGIKTVDTAGSYHSSIAFRMDHYYAGARWPLDRLGNFDQRFMGLFPSWSDSLMVGRKLGPQSATHLFRWNSGSYHGQGFMSGPDGGESWWTTCGVPDGSEVIPRPITPNMDDFTRAVFAGLNPTTGGKLNRHRMTQEFYAEISAPGK